MTQPLDLGLLERVAREATPAMHAFSMPYQQAFNPKDMLALIARLRAAEARADDAERRGWIAGRDAVVQLALQTEEVPDDELGTVIIDKWDWDSDFLDVALALSPPQEPLANG